MRLQSRNQAFKGAPCKGVTCKKGPKTTTTALGAQAAWSDRGSRLVWQGRLVRGSKLGRVGRLAGGQMVVEYVLLLVVSIAMAALMVRLMVSRSPDNPGLIIHKWQQLIEFVATDDPEDL